MGNWCLSIRGVGAHHNKKYAADANRMLAKFVQELKAAGHTIQCATITHGGEDIVTDADQYLADRDAYDAS